MTPPGSTVPAPLTVASVQAMIEAAGEARDLERKRGALPWLEYAAAASAVEQLGGLVLRYLRAEGADVEAWRSAASRWDAVGEIAARAGVIVLADAVVAARAEAAALREELRDVERELADYQALARGRTL